MNEKNLNSAISYYQAMNDKDLSIIEKYLHPEVHMMSPLAQVHGKEAVLNAVKHFLPVFTRLMIRAKCSREDQVMLAYDLDCPPPFGLIRGAVLLTFSEGLILRYELFYDARPFVQKKDEIFSN